jgi:uncharacterized protein YdhG (YjbR/CyaY superfamily)
VEKEQNAVDQYISGFPREMQKILQKVRQTIRETAPEAEETIGYGIPTYKLNGNLVHFGGFKHHVGFYPTPSALTDFQDELSRYEGAKGSVKFPLDQPMPLELIAKITKQRVQENLAKKK